LICLCVLFFIGVSYEDKKRIKKDIRVDEGCRLRPETVGCVYPMYL